MSDLDWLFGSTAPASLTATKTDQTNNPAWYQDIVQGLTAKASGIANEPYTPYSGPRIAGLTPLQTQAIGGATTAGQAGADTLSQGANLASIAGNTQFDPHQFQDFLSPYTTGVVDRIAQLGQKDLEQNILPSINNSFIGSGMPFGTRHADVTAQALDNSQQNILGQQASALQSSYDSAMSNYQNALQRQASTGGILAGIGTGQTQNDLQAGGYQNIMGGVQQANQQQNLDTAYQDFLTQKQYPLQQLNTVNSIVRGYSPTNSTTTNVTAPAGPSTNAGQAALGALSSFFGKA